MSENKFKFTIMVGLLFCSLLILTFTVHSVGEEIYLDFSSYPNGPAQTRGIRSWNSSGTDKNPYYKNSLRLLYQGSNLSAKFYLKSQPRQTELQVTHLSSKSDNCRGNGYSPVTISINGRSLVRNYDVAQHHGGNHGYEKDSWDISQYLQSGVNQISWEAGNLCTHYWIKRFVIETTRVGTEQSGSETYQTDDLMVFETGENLGSKNLRENLESWAKGELFQQLVTHGLKAIGPTPAILGPAGLATSAISVLNSYYNYEYVFPKAIDLYTFVPTDEGVYSHYPTGFFRLKGFIGSWKVGDPFFYVILASPELAGRKVTLSFEKQVAFEKNKPVDRKVVNCPKRIGNSKLSYLIVKSPVKVYKRGVYEIKACYSGKCEVASVEFLD